MKKEDKTEAAVFILTPKIWIVIKILLFFLSVFVSENEMSFDL